MAEQPRKKRRRARAEAATPAETAAMCVDRASSCLEELPPDTSRARQFFEAALVAAPDNVATVQQCATFFSEEGDLERAKELFQRCVALQPDQGADKYLYLAQITGGTEALANYQRGAAILQAQNKQAGMDKGGNVASEVGADRAKQLAGAFAAIAELYMTDLCDEPDAEAKCEEALQQGLESDATCLEVNVAKATLRKTQGSLDEARQLGLECADKIKCDREHALALTEDAEAFVGPSDEVQASLCRTLIDLGNTSEARDLLVALLEQDDEDIQVWYLLGCCHLVERDAPAVLDCVDQGIQLCERNGDELGEWRTSFSTLKDQASEIAVGDGEGEAEGDDVAAKAAPS